MRVPRTLVAAAAIVAAGAGFAASSQTGQRPATSNQTGQRAATSMVVYKSPT